MTGKLESGRSLTDVFEEYEIDKSVMSRAWKVFQRTGTAVTKVGGSRTWKKRYVMTGTRQW